MTSPDSAPRDVARAHRIRPLASIGLASLILVCLLAFLVTRWRSLPDYEWRFSPGWLMLGVGATASCYVLQGELWRALLGALNEKIEPRSARAVWAKSLLARYIPTSIFLVVTRVALASRHGVRRRVCLVSVVYELALGLSAAGILASYFIVTVPALEGRPGRFAVLGVIPLAFVALHPRFFKPLADFVLRKFGRPELDEVLPLSTVSVFMLFYVVSWLLMGVGLLAFAASLHPISAGESPYVVASYSVGFIVAVLTFVVPGGLGTRDATVAASLAATVPGPVATAIALGFRLLETAVELVYLAVTVTIARREVRPR